MATGSGVARNDELLRLNGDRLLGDELEWWEVSIALVDDSEGDLLNLERMEEGIEQC